MHKGLLIGFASGLGVAVILVTAYFLGVSSRTSAPHTGSIESSEPPEIPAAETQGRRTAEASEATSSSTTSALPWPTSSFHPGSSINAMCKVHSAGGTFYITIVSPEERDFLACQGLNPVPADLGPILTSGPRVDLRCSNPESNSLVPPPTTIGIYSSTLDADFNAAMAYCTANDMLLYEGVR